MSIEDDPTAALTPRYRMNGAEVEATQWFANGDHPGDRVGERLRDLLFAPEEHVYYTRLEGAVVRYYRHPDVPGTSECSKCGHTMHVHGWLDTGGLGQNVCPGDFIITGVGGEMYPCPPSVVTATYGPIEQTLPPEDAP
jgi:hypothetical protein